MSSDSTATAAAAAAAVAQSSAPPSSAPAPDLAPASPVEELLAQLTRQLASPGGADWIKEATQKEGLVNIFDLANAEAHVLAAANEASAGRK